MFPIAFYLSRFSFPSPISVFFNDTRDVHLHHIYFICITLHCFLFQSTCPLQIYLFISSDLWMLSSVYSVRKVCENNWLFCYLSNISLSWMTWMSWIDWEESVLHRFQVAFSILLKRKPKCFIYFCIRENWEAVFL